MENLVTKYNLDVCGIVHVGAHDAEELQEYRRLFGPVPIVWVEADPDVAARLKARLNVRDPKSQVVSAVVSDVDAQDVVFHRANNEQSSSILELGTHLTAHPEVEYVGSVELKTQCLDNMADYCDFNAYNFLNIDTQGAEGKIIKGGLRFLEGVEYIYAEVNEDEVYVGCMKLPEFDALLASAGFKRVELEMSGNHGWGDAFYVRA